MNTEHRRRSFLAAVAGGVIATPLLGAERATGQRGPSIAIGDGWPSHRYDGGNTGAAPGVPLSGPLAESWSIETDGTDLTPPVRADGVLLYGTDDGDIVARDSVGGELLWREATGTFRMPAPAVSGGKAFIAGERITARDAADGSEVWAANTDESGAAYPVLHRGRVHVTATSRVMYALSTGTGERAWSHASRGALQAPMALSGDRAFAVDDSGFLYSIDDGDREWRVALGGSVEAAPVAGGDLVYAITEDETVYALDQSDGSEAWTASITNSTEIPPLLADGQCVVTEPLGRLTAFDAAVGTSVWTVDVEGRIRTPPIRVGEMCVVGTDTGEVIGMEFESGQESWSRSLLEEPIVGICGGPDQIHVTGADGGIAGAYVQGALESREAIRELERLIDRAGTQDISVAQPRDRLNTAVEKLDDRAYDDATEEAIVGAEELEGALEEVESLYGSIERLRQEVAELRENGPVETEDISETIDDAERALENGDVETARERIDRANELLEDRAGDFRAAVDAIDALDATVADAREADVVVGDAPTALSSSEDALSDGDVERAREIATEATTKLEERIDTAVAARRRIPELESTIEDAEADDIRVPDGRAALNEAQTQLTNDKYTAALEAANDGIASVDETVRLAERAAATIERAEAFSPIQPGVTTLAKRQGTPALIEDARAALEADEYSRALALADEARSIQRRSRWAVDGTIGAAAVGGLTLYRYGSLDRSAALLSKYTDFTSEEEDE